MSLRITGLPPPTPTTARKPESLRERPEQSAAGEPAATAQGMGPPPTPVSDTWEPSGDPSGGQPASAAPGDGPPEDSAAVIAALRTADQVRRDAIEAPARAARAHANLVPATVLNLLA